MDNDTMTPSENLIARLKEKQHDRSLDEFGEEIGVDKSQLSEFYRGLGQLGIKVLGVIRLRYPDLTPEIAAYLEEQGRRHLANRKKIPA